MNNKKKFAFLTLALTMGLIIGACTSNKSSSNPASSSSITPSSSSSSNGDISSDSSKPSSSSSSSSSVTPSSSSSVIPSSSSSSSSSSSIPSSSSSSSSTSSPVTTYTVSFVVDGKVVETQQVEPNDQVTFKGETPTKAADENACKYRFKGWDRDIDEPINSDTTFTAIFAEYAKEIVVDDFENYSGAGSLKDAGWAAWTLGGSGWTTETQAAVSISRNAADGNKALRLDAWQNDCDFKAVKTLAKPFEKSANAIQFKLMIPSEMKSVKLLLKGEIEIGGKLQSPSFSYILHPTSSEYMEYTIPLADDNWLLWDEQGKSIKAVAGWMGIHEDDYLNYLTSIDFYARGNDGLGGQPYLAFIDSVKFVTLDDAAFAQTQKLKQYDRYTGTLADGHILRVDLDANGGATAKVIDLEEPQTIPGNYVIENDEITFTSADDGASLVYKGSITNGGQLIKYKSATGNFANAVADMNLDAVQVVNNFEQYSESGEAYSQQNFDDTIGSGLRGDFYSEYYVGSGSSDWAGNGWQLMPNGDEINLIKDGASAHSGNNYASFKHFSQNGARYMPWDLFKGNADKNSFRGTTLSFWAKGYVNKLKVSMYSQSQPTNVTRDKYVKVGQFNEGKVVDEWTHLEIELNPKYVYYGFMILIDNDYQGDGQLLIDDIEVYTANPYAVYEEPVPPEPKHFDAAQNYLAKLNGMLPVQLSFDRNNEVHLSVPHKSIMVNGTYAIDEDDVTITIGETAYTATIADDYSKLSFKGINGSDNVAEILNNLSFNQVDFAETGESYDGVGQMYYDGFTDEKGISGARGAYYCDRWLGSGSTPVGGNGWGLMGGNGDQIGLEQGGPVGYQYPTFKRSKGASLRYLQWDLYKGTAKERKGADSFNVWLKNPANNEMHIKLYVFKNQQITPTNQTERVELETTIPANQDWTMYSVPLNPEVSYYGFGIYTYQGETDAYLGLDGAYFCGVDDNPNYAYYTKNNMILSGNTNLGEATIKFSTAGKAYLTCANASISNQQVSYTMNVGEAGQEMVIKMGNDVIKGIYAVDTEYKATLTITEATGSLAALVNNGAIFSNQ